MSVRAQVAVIEHSKTRGLDYLVLFMIADGVDHTGLADPFLKDLADRCRLSEQEMVEVLDRLEAAGEITVVPYHGYLKIAIRCVPPEVCLGVSKPKKRFISRAVRRVVMERDGSCRHCGTTENLCLDHIYPESLGGETTVENLQVLCRSCNSKKGVRVLL